MQAMEMIYGQSPEKCLCLLLAYARACHWDFYTSHWTVKGDAFYGKHLLFQRLYEEIEPSFDGLAEKIIGTFNCHELLTSSNQMEMAKMWLSQVDTISCPFERSLALLEMGQLWIEKCLQMEMSTGIVNFLEDLADKQEDKIYLIQQHLR